MNASDSADKTIELYLDGIRFLLQITGECSKNLIAFLMAMQKEKRQTKGKTRLTNMLKTGKELKIITINAKDLKKFSQEARKYGVLYCVLANKQNEKIDGLVDIMVRQEDAAKVNRIAERFNFGTVDTAKIKQELEQTKQKQDERSRDEEIIDRLLAEPKEIEEQKENGNEKSPIGDWTEEKNPSESSLDTKNNYENDKLYNNGKKSVKKELKEIEKEQKAEREKQAKELETNYTNNEKEEKETNVAVVANKQKNQESKHLKEEKDQYKAKHLKEPKHFDIQNNKKRKRKKHKVKERSK